MTLAGKAMCERVHKEFPRVFVRKKHIGAVDREGMILPRDVDVTAPCHVAVRHKIRPITRPSLDGSIFHHQLPGHTPSVRT